MPDASSDFSRKPVSMIFLVAFCLVCLPICLLAADDVYQMPPKEIADLIDAPSTPQVSVSPDNTWMLLIQLPDLPSIEEVSQPELRLAGIRINPRTNGPSRRAYGNAITFKKMKDGAETPVTGLPDNPKISGFSWSPNSEMVAFTVTGTDRITLWVARVSDGKATQVSDLSLNGAYGGIYDWLSDSKHIVLKAVPSNRGEAPAEPTVPVGPIIQENLGRKAPARTYQDLLKNPYDEAMFDHYVKSQICRISLDGETTALGPIGVIRSMDPSPDGKYLLVQTVQKPYSYTVPLYRFPHKVEVWDSKDGSVVHTLADLPLADQVPIAFGSTTTGPRSVVWRADAKATLCWAEAQDGGDAGAEADVRDQLFLLEAPFDGQPVPWMKLGLRFDSVIWGSEKLALVSEWWWNTRQQRVWKTEPGKPTAEAVLLQDRSWEDRYNDPGNPLRHPNKYGRSVLLTGDNGNTLFLSGAGASDEGDRPFLDEFNLTTLESKRLFRSEAPYYESPSRLIDPKKRLVLTRRESVTEPPNYFIRDLKKNDLRQITEFKHPTPQLTEVKKELIRYTRDDGVELTGTLYLPPGYTPEDGPLPMLMWAYPQEYKSASAAGQVTDSPYRFIRVGWWSPMLWLVHGYAVLDHPTMPVVGEGDEEPNDTFVKQLVASAQAAIDEVVRRGVADRDRIAIGGHSYGAFMTANLLAHSDLYRAGLARSGAYNRTLTPFGFQSEERTIWQAPEIYFEMSPFMHAEKIDEPLLLVHGEADNNSGTFPLQSERFYGALKGQGATVRLVMLPHESHSYRARESVMHLLWETTQWLDTYVTNAGPREEAATE